MGSKRKIPIAHDEVVGRFARQLRALRAERGMTQGELARRAGVTAADVDRVETGPDAAGWSGRERALLDAVDALVADHDLDDERWAELSGHLDERGMIELVLLVGHYEMLATAIATLRIVPDRRRRGRG